MICPNCKIEYDENATTVHTCKFEADPYPLKDAPYLVPEAMLKHKDWAFDIKISNDNTKGEKRATVHVRSDGEGMDAVKLAHTLYKEVLGS